MFENMRKPMAVVKHVGMVAGGTGITPMLQIITAIMKDRSDMTQVHLLFANQTEEDILVRDMLEKLRDQNPKRFALHYTLDRYLTTYLTGRVPLLPLQPRLKLRFQQLCRPPAGWQGFSGFITEAMLKDTMPGAADESVVLMCGPPVMVDRAVRPNLEKLGFDKTQMLAF